MRNKYSTPFSARQASVSRRQLLRWSVMAGTGLAGAAVVGCRTAAPPAAAPAEAPKAAATGATGATGPERPGVPVVKGTQKSGGTWTVGVTLTSPQQDMHTALAASIWHDLSERALVPDPWTNEITANIIAKWEIPDNTHFVLHVKPGVKLHNKPPWNGRDFNAEDLAFNIDRIAGNTAEAEGLQKAAFQRAQTLGGMSKVEVVDKSTVKVTMAQPSSAWLKGFLEWRNLLMPKGVVENGFKDPMTFAGFSAFSLTEFVPNVREVFTKFPNYHRTGEPHFDRVVHTVVPDRAAGMAGFISKQFSTFGDPTPQDVQTIKAARPDALIYETPTNHWNYLWPSSKFGPFMDVRVRKALQLGLDVAELGDGYYGSGWGYTGIICAAFPDGWTQEKVKGLPGVNPATKAKDREEAQKLLTAAAFPNGKGIVFELLTEGSSVRHENGVRMQAQLSQTFKEIKVTMKPVSDRAQFANLQNTRNFHAMSYSSICQPDAASEAYSLYHSKGGRNYGVFSNAEADAMLDKALVELDRKARDEILAKFQEKAFNEWVPIIPLFTNAGRTALQPTISGYDKLVGPWSPGLQYERLGSLYNV